MVMLVSSWFLSLLYLVAIAVLWGQNDWGTFLATMIVLWICFGGNVILFFLLSTLLILHVYLLYNSLTTFEFITGKSTVVNSNSLNNRPHMTEEVLDQPDKRQIIHLESQEKFSKKNENSEEQFSKRDENSEQHIIACTTADKIGEEGNR